MNRSELLLTSFHRSNSLLFLFYKFSFTSIHLNILTFLKPQNEVEFCSKCRPTPAPAAQHAATSKCCIAELMFHMGLTEARKDAGQGLSARACAPVLRVLGRLRQPQSRLSDTSVGTGGDISHRLSPAQPIQTGL